MEKLKLKEPAYVIDLAAVNKHHVPGTAFHWRHNYEPLDSYTAIKWHKQVYAKNLQASGASFFHEEPGWVKNVPRPAHGVKVFDKNGHEVSVENPSPKFAAAKPGAKLGLKKNTKFNANAKKKVAPLPKSAPFSEKKVASTLVTPGATVHVPGNGGGKATVVSFDEKLNSVVVKFEKSGKEQKIAATTLKKYDPSLDFSGLKPFTDTNKEHHGENDSLLLSNKMGEVIPKPNADEASGYTKHTPDSRLTNLPAIKSYTGSGYRTINGALREGGTHPNAAAIRKDLSKTALPGGLKLYRGVSHKTISQVIAQQGAGHSFSEPGFSSTARNYSAAFGGSMRLHITTAPGLRGAGVENVSSVGPGEREVLLDAGTHFVTQRVESAPNGQLIAHVIAHNPEDKRGIQASINKALQAGSTIGKF